MTDKPEGPTLAARVAELRGLDFAIVNLETGNIWACDSYPESFAVIIGPALHWDSADWMLSESHYRPDQPGADAWELQEHVRELGYSVTYTSHVNDHECWIDKPDPMDSRTVATYSGANDAEALCRAYVAMRESG